MTCEDILEGMTDAELMALEKMARRIRNSRRFEESPCAVCGAWFRPRRKTMIYCNHRCGQKAYVRRYRGKPINDMDFDTVRQRWSRDHV